MNTLSWPAEPAHFPAALTLLEVLALSELCRSAAASLEALCDESYEPGTLRRRAHAVIRGLHLELEGQVSLRTRRATSTRSTCCCAPA